MTTSIVKPLAAAIAPVLGAAILFGPPAHAADLAQQSSANGGVAIAVKPIEISAKAASWSFQVTLTTHSQELNDDLVRTADIVDGAGKKASPTTWEGDAPGGHHRKGVLRFKALTPPPEAIELQIQRPGESGPRKFNWKLK